jgi:hypothetical protein
MTRLKTTPLRGMYRKMRRLVPRTRQLIFKKLGEPRKNATSLLPRH